MLCNANVVIEYNRRRSGLPSEPLDMEYDNNRTRDIAIALNIQHNPPLFAYLYICISASSHICIFTYLHIHILHAELSLSLRAAAQISAISEHLC